MQELIDKLKNDHGLTTEQSHGILATVTDFIKKKFPMVEGMIDGLFHHHSNTESAAPAETEPNVAGDAGTSDSTVNKGGSFMDKISDIIPGQAGEKVEQFAKDKLGGLFGGNK